MAYLNLSPLLGTKVVVRIMLDPLRHPLSFDHAYF